MTREEKHLRTLRHARIRRVKQFLKWMPRKANLDRYPVLRWFAKAARKRPYLWSFKISSCTPAFYFGSLIAFMPLMGVQIILAFAAALFLRANLPITVGLQAISNPLTFLLLYRLNFLIGRTTMDFLGLGTELNFILSGMQATFLGGIILGLTVGAVLDLFYRLTVYEAAKLASVRRRDREEDPLESGEALAAGPEPVKQEKPEERPAETPEK